MRVAPRVRSGPSLAGDQAFEMGVASVAASVRSEAGGPRTLVAFATIVGHAFAPAPMRTPKHRKPPVHDIERLRTLVQTFVRSFGLLVTRETPCGQPVSPSYAHALMVLLERARQPARTLQSDLGLVLGIDKSNVARLCARMEAAGHVVQERQPEDGRGRLVHLTNTGTRLARRIEGASQERFERVVCGIPSGRRRALFESIELLNTAVEALGDQQEKP